MATWYKDKHCEFWTDEDPESAIKMAKVLKLGQHPKVRSHSFWDRLPVVGAILAFIGNLKSGP